VARGAGKRSELARVVAERGWQRIGEAEWRELYDTLAPISESYLRKLVRDSGVELAPLVAGVRQASLDELHASLLALIEEYEAGDNDRRTAIRRLIITAKDHARWAAKRSEEKRPEKEEMILWMTTWLENPPVFPAWIKLRRAT
jgi:hypothetical protein